MAVPRRFALDCDGALQAIRRASDPAVPEFVPYTGNVVTVAVWWARYVARRARQLGLVPGDGRAR